MKILYGQDRYDLSTIYRRTVHRMKFFPLRQLCGSRKSFRQFGQGVSLGACAWDIMRLLRNFSLWFATSMRAYHAQSHMHANSLLALMFLLESGRDVFYHHSRSCWLLTGLQERLQQTRETESSGHCWPTWTTSAMLLTWFSFRITYGSYRRKYQTWTILRSWGWPLTSTDATLKSWGRTQQMNILSPLGGATWGCGIF